MRAPSTFLAILLLAAACARSAVPVVPPPAPVPIPPPPAPEAPPLEQLTVCVIRDGVMGNVSVSYNPATGDSLYEGRRFSDAFPTDSTFAAGTSWYDRNDLPVFNGRRYWSTGLPQPMRPGEVVARGKYRGLTVFVSPGTRARIGFFYLPVRPTCEFQMYQTETGGEIQIYKKRPG